MPKSKVQLPGIQIDLSEAVVEAATASAIDFELKLKGVKVPGRRLSRVLLRFEGIKDFDQTWYKLNTKVRKSGKSEIHDAWPLKLPAALKTLVELKSRGSLRKFQFAVDEEHFRGAKKPIEFSCKRLCITDTKGSHVAGDASKISSFQMWSEKDSVQVAEQFATAIESHNFRNAHQLFESQFAKSTPVAKLTDQFERLMKRRRHLEVLMEEFDTGNSHEHLPVARIDFPDVVPKSVDLDEVVAVVQTGFLGWFVVDLVIVEQHGDLKIGHYTVNRDWEMAYC